jgi:hypothetical protein
MSEERIQPPRNHPGNEKLFLGLTLALEGCCERLAAFEECEHDGCDCDELEQEEIQGLRYMIANCETVVSSQYIIGFKILQWLKKRGFPPARTLADIVRAWILAADGRGGEAGRTWFSDAAEIKFSDN